MDEKKVSWWKENSAVIIPSLILIALLLYSILLSPRGAVVLATPSTVECARTLVAEAEKLKPGKKFRVEVVEEGNLQVLGDKKAIALVAPFSQELAAAGAVPIGVDALVVVSADGRGVNQQDLAFLNSKGKVFYPGKDLWPFYQYQVGPVPKQAKVFSPGVSIGGEAIGFASWSQAKKMGLKIGAYNGMLANENTISILQYPLWYRIFLVVSSEEEAKKAGAEYLIKAARQKSYKEALKERGFFVWPE